MKSDMQVPSPSANDELSRIGVAVPTSLLDPFDQLIARKGYTNRSEALRDLMRDTLIGRASQIRTQTSSEL